MAAELIYTSVPKGLNRGESGFCVVACSANLKPVLMHRLQAMSGYKELFSAIGPQAEDNPVNFSNVDLNCGGEQFQVVSRIAFAGLDYSGRSNKIADHLILTPTEMSNIGPAELMSVDGIFHTAWHRPPALLPDCAKLIPQRSATQPGQGDYWRQITGAVGWDEHLIALSEANPEQPVYIITDLKIDNLRLIREALALLPPVEQWQYSFSTYYSGAVHGVNYRWRFIYPQTPLYHKIKGNRRLLTLELHNMPPTREMLKRRIAPEKVKQKLKIKNLQATLVPERYRRQPSEEKISAVPSLRWHSRGWILLLVVAAALLFGSLSLWRRSAVNRATAAPAGIAKRVTVGDNMIVKRDSKSVMGGTTAQRARPTAAKRGSSVRPAAVLIPQRWRLTPQMMTAVSVAIPWRKLLQRQIKPGHSVSTVILKVPVLLSSAEVEKCLRNSRVEVAATDAGGEVTLHLNLSKLVGQAAAELAKGIDAKRVISLVDSKPAIPLAMLIRRELSCKVGGDNKTLYEKSAEYLLGELAPLYRNKYNSYAVARAAVMKKHRRERMKLRQINKEIEQLNGSLSDNSLTLTRRRILQQQVDKLRRETETVRLNLSDTEKRLRLRREPAALTAVRRTLLAAFFCLARNYMPEARKILALGRQGDYIERLNDIIEKTDNRQQFDYENSFKHALDGYLYRVIEQHIERQLRAGPELQSMLLLYRPDDKSFKLIIEDN